MQHTKYDELKGLIAGLTDRVAAQAKMGRSTLTLMKDFDHRLEAMRNVMIAKGSLTLDEFDVECDKLRGLRLKGDAEPIGVDDIAWVGYEAFVDGKLVAKEDLLPIRVGSGTINFEEGLIGHFPNEQSVKYNFVLPDGPKKGKEVNFVINIGRVKTHIVGEKDGTDELDQPVGGDEGAGIDAAPQPDDQSSGSGNEERGDGQPSDLPAEPAGDQKPSESGDQSSADANGTPAGT